MYAEIKAYYSIPFEEYHMPIHRHARYEIMYALTGSCKIWADGQSFRLKPGWFLYIRQNVPHQLIVAQGTPCHILNLEFSVSAEAGGLDITEFFQQEADSAALLNCRCMLNQDGTHVCHALQDLIRELGGPHSDPFAMRLLFMRLLLELTRCLRQKELPPGQLYVKRAAQYLQQHFEDPVTAEEVACAVGIHPSYLQTLFKKHYHCTMVDYLNRQRLQKAQFLLKNSDLDIIDIAVACGFHSRQHFSYTFKRHCGVSPGAFRRMNGGESDVVTGGFIRLAPTDPNPN